MDITELPVITKPGVPSWAELRHGKDESGKECYVLTDKEHTAHVQSDTANIKVMRGNLGSYLFEKRHPGKFSIMIRDKAHAPGSWSDLWEEYRALTGSKVTG
jgi:hypothetical protein